MRPGSTRLVILGLAGLVLAGPVLAEAPAERQVRETVRQDRQSLRVRETERNRARVNRAETRLDAIERKAESDPAAAREMLRIFEADQRLEEGTK